MFTCLISHRSTRMPLNSCMLRKCMSELQAVLTHSLRGNDTYLDAGIVLLFSPLTVLVISFNPPHGAHQQFKSLCSRKVSVVVLCVGMSSGYC